jgi:hypothetical protein
VELTGAPDESAEHLVVRLVDLRMHQLPDLARFETSMDHSTLVSAKSPVVIAKFAAPYQPLLQCMLRSMHGRLPELPKLVEFCSRAVCRQPPLFLE